MMSPTGQIQQQHQHSIINSQTPSYHHQSHVQSHHGRHRSGGTTPGNPSSEEDFNQLFSPLKFLTTLDAERSERDAGILAAQHSNHNINYDDPGLGVTPFDVNDMDPAASNVYFDLTGDELGAPGNNAQPHILRRQGRNRRKDDIVSHPISYTVMEVFGTHQNVFDFQNDLSFEVTNGLMSSLYPNPTAQSTPVGTKKTTASSMLTTPNNSVLLSEEQPSALGPTLGHTTPTKSQKSSPSKHPSRLSDAPRTPTPFKKALADVFNRGEPLSNMV